MIKLTLFRQTTLGYGFTRLISLGADIPLTRKLKLFFVLSIQHSLFYRKEDLINANYLISLQLILRLRSYER